MAASSVKLVAVPGIKLIEPGDDLATIIGGAIRAAGLALGDRHVLVVAQKTLSKAGGPYVALAEVAPSPQALDLGEIVAKDPCFVEIVLSESAEVVRYRKDVL